MLGFGIQYLGEIVDIMTLASVREFVFDYVPRKVSAEPDAAANIIYELTKFWEYLDRVYKLPQAKAIVDWLKADNVKSELEKEMSNTANFGMAKSLFMMGKRSGFDMNSEAGRNAFMTAYNESLGSIPSQSTAPPPSAATGRAAPAQRVGRNDLCPCGSGKKFKKCCRRVD